MGARKVIDDFIKKTARNELDKQALIQLALQEEVGLPTPQNDLPNLKKDRLVLELVNRTNQSQSISLFALPTGSNSSQNLNYGDLFETVYSAVTIPKTEISTLQNYTINWVDKDGVSQTATTLDVNNIDNLISELNLITGDNFFYYDSGTNYVIHKIPIDTWLYWDAPSVLVTSANAIQYTMTTPTPAQGAKAYYANDYGIGDVLFTVTQGHLVSYRLGVVGEAQNLDLDALYGFGTTGDQFLVPTDTATQKLYVFSQSTKLLLRFGTLSSGVPVFETQLLLANGSQGMTFTQENVNLLWSSGITAATSIFVYDEDGVLLDTWGAPQLSLGSNIPSARGYSKIIYNDSGIAQGYWIIRGKAGDPTNIKGFQQIGGWDTIGNAIVQSFVGSGIYFEDEIQSQLGLSLDTNDEISFYARISDTNRYFVVISNTVLTQQNYIGIVNMDNGDQSWKFYDNNDLSIDGDVYYSTKTNSIIARMDYLGGSSARSINIDTLEASSINLENVSYDVGAIYVYDTDSLLFKSSLAPNGFASYTLAGGEETVPSNSQSASFYTENTFGDITGNTTTNQYFFSSFNVIGGTGISVTETNGNLTYQELVQELRDTIEPYFFDAFSVYCQNDTQANTPITKISRGGMGQSRTLINNPTLLTENNSVIINTPVNFLPQTINKLDYRIAAFNTVKIIINYTKGNLNAIAQTLNEYIEDGIPFSVGINQLSESVSIRDAEKSYLKNVLYKMWEQKKKELREEGVQIEIDNMFESQAVIDEKKNQMIGAKMKAVKDMMYKQKMKDMGLEGLSPDNIKRIVSNYTAKGKADKIYDPYNYFSDDE